MKNNSSHMERKIQSAAKGNAIVGRAPNTDVFAHPERDLGHAWAFLHSEATTVSAALLEARFEASELTYRETDAAMTTLDKISKFYIQFYSAALQNQAGAIGSFSQLHEQLETDLDKEVFSMYNAALAQSMGCYLFAAQSMALGLTPDTAQDSFESATALTMLNSLSDDLRRKVLKEWQDNGYVPSNADVKSVVRATEPYMDIILKAQEIQKKAKAEEK